MDKKEYQIVLRMDVELAAICRKIAHTETRSMNQFFVNCVKEYCYRQLPESREVSEPIIKDIRNFFAK